MICDIRWHQSLHSELALLQSPFTVFFFSVCYVYDIVSLCMHDFTCECFFSVYNFGCGYIFFLCMILCVLFYACVILGVDIFPVNDIVCGYFFVWIFFKCMLLCVNIFPVYDFVCGYFSCI